MATNARILSGLLIVVCFSACAPGLIYTDIKEPYCTNMRDTFVGEREGKAETKQFRIPYVAPGLTATWNSNALADAAGRAGIQELQYCDLETFSVLGGIWRRQSIVVYGK